MKLTDTQLVLLSAASQREDGAVVLAPNLKGGAASKVVGKLLRDGLIEEGSAAASLPAWRRDDDAGPLSRCPSHLSTQIPFRQLRKCRP